jgi:hypothetical protein
LLKIAKSPEVTAPVISTLALLTFATVTSITGLTIPDSEMLLIRLKRLVKERGFIRTSAKQHLGKQWC